MKIDASTGFSGDGRTDDVDEPHDHGALVLGFTDGGQGVSGLARLGDGDDEITSVDERVTVTEFSGGLNFGLDGGKVLERKIPHHAGMQGGAASDHDNALQIDEFPGSGPHA